MRFLDFLIVGLAALSLYAKKLVPGEDFVVRISNVNLEMVYVKAGTFVMGASEEDGEAGSAEKPAHEVTLTKDYYISRYEVTQGLWKAVMGKNPSLFMHGDDYPVEQVSWTDAQEFCRKLSRMTGRKYVLPTEAQWEFAARGGVKSKGFKYSGSNVLDEVAWYLDNSKYETHPVGQKQPNELGIYDMSGNVWEWCQDQYNAYGGEPQTDPLGVADIDSRVLRGGSWGSDAKKYRISGRHELRPSSSYNGTGFRLVLIP